MVVGEIARPVQTLVIGGGPGGYTAAARAADLGQEVVLIESGRLGGVCLNVGCIPSKALITAAHQHERAAAFAARGLPAAEGPVDLAGIMAWKDDVVDTLVSGVGGKLSKVEVINGFARLLDDRRVSIEHDDQVSHIQFDNCILATGSTPIHLADLPITADGVAADVRIVDSTGALALHDVPLSLAVVGGGYIGLELGTAFAKLGSSVTIIEATEHIGVGFDPDLTAVVGDRLKQLGVAVMTGTTALGVSSTGIRVATQDGESEVVADVVLVAVGRRSNVADLQLDNAGLVLDERGLIPVDDQLHTTSRRIFAIGDLVAGPALAHKASTEGRIAAEVISGLPSAVDAEVPLIAFTDPELASVGMTQGQAADAGIDTVVGTARFAHCGRALTLGDGAEHVGADGLVKLVVDADDETIIGVAIVGPGASDLIAEGALAVEMRARLADLLGTVHPHPTLSESLHDAALVASRRLERRR